MTGTATLSRMRMLALAGAVTGTTLVLLAAWTLFYADLDPVLGALGIPALAGPILHPHLPTRLFSRYLAIGMLTTIVALTLGWIAR